MVLQKLGGESLRPPELELGSEKEAAQLVLIFLGAQKDWEKSGNRNQLCCLSAKALLSDATKDEK